MKSKKIIFGIVIVAILAIGGISLSISSKDSSTSQNESTENSETTTDSNTTSTPEENSNTASTEASTNNETNTTTEASTNNGESTNNEASTNSSAATNASFNSQDAAKEILKFYLDEDLSASQRLTPISLEGNVAKKQDNSNTFFSDEEELSDNTKSGLIIILDHYDEAAKTYKYTLKDYFNISNDGNIGTGTVKSDGTVLEDEIQ